MNRLLTLALVAATLAAATLLVATLPMLPDPVATHFAAGGRANGWMTRQGYLAFTLGFNVLLPWVVFAIAGFVSPRFTRWDEARDRGHWMHPSRREASTATMRDFAAVLGLLVALLASAMHVVLIEANAKSPPMLDERLFFTVLGVFVVGLGAIVVGYARRFPRNR